MKKLKLFALALLATLSMGAMAETTLFSTNFSDAIWSDYSTICDGTVYEDTINGIIFRSADNNKSFSIADGALTFCDNNIGDKYYMLIHLVGVNTKVNVVIGTVSNSQRISYKWFEQSERPTSSSGATATAANINTEQQISLEYSMTGTEVWLMLGRQGSGMGTVIKSILITTQDGSAPTCTDADATFAAASTAIAIAADATNATTTLTFTKGDNASDATYEVLKDGNATTDATVADGVFTATQAGTYTVKAVQAADGTYCEVVKEVSITVTDNRPVSACAVIIPAADGDSLKIGDEVALDVNSEGGKIFVAGMKTEKSSILYNKSGLQLSGGGADSIRIELNNYLKEGSVIELKMVAGGESERGLNILTTAKKSVYKATWKPEANGEEKTITYTVTASDGLAGASKFLLQRNNTVYLVSVSVSNCGSEVPGIVVDDTPVLTASKATVELAVTAANPTASAKVTFTGKNLANGTYNLTVPTVAGMTVTPTSVTVANGKLSQEVEITYTSTADVAAATAELSLKIGDLEPKVEISYSAQMAKAYAIGSLNIEKLVLDYSKKYDIEAALTANNMEYSNIHELDSLNGEKDNNNSPYIGLKIKTAGGYIAMWIKKDDVLRVKFGYVGNDLKLTINGVESTLTAEQAAANYEYTATEDTYIKIATTSKSTVVFKQIMLNEAIADITYPDPITALSELEELDMNAPMYNVLGQQVGADFKGIVIQNGQKFILR